MRFSTKVFLATSVLSSACVLSASFLVQEAARRIFEHQYETEYRQRIEALARDFVSIENAYDRAAVNAAKFVREVDRANRGRFKEGELESLAREAGVSAISIIDSKGDFLHSSDGEHEINLFDYCPAYEGLLTGAISEQQTPLLPDKKNTDLIAKFTMIPNHDRTRIIDVSVRFDDTAKMLQQLVDDESDVIAVTLRSPTGVELGEVKSKTYEEHAAGPHTRILTEVAADEADCCECQVRKLVDGKKKYTYRFDVEVSLHALNQAMAKLKARFLAVFAVLLALSLLVSYWVSRFLVRKIDAIRNSVDQIAAAGDFSKSIPVAAPAGKGDELDALALHFNRMFDSVRNAQGELIEAKKAEARAAVASQVAHDIRSPLTSMMLALNQLQETLQKSGAHAAAAPLISVLSNGISRVSGIVKRLSKTHGQIGAASAEVEAPRLTLIDKLFFDVAQEHALKTSASQVFDIRGFTPVPASWAVVQVTEIQAALSNILNNAAEAVGPEGAVRLDVKVEGQLLTAKIIDNGKGISPENIGRIFEREFTSGKEGGSGLGLYQAKRAVEWSGGKIKVESVLGKGTIVTITLPLEKTPSWCLDELSMSSEQTLVVADDDPTILAAWREKAAAAGVMIREFPSIQALDNALSGLGALDTMVFVLDQYAGDGRDGLTGTGFIEKHKLGSAATLSTSEFDDPAIQDRVKLLKAGLLPKARLAVVRIKT